MISRTFIDRPVLAWVISILIMLGGVAGIALLPVEQYPDIAPPSVNIRASYPGASAETLESSVTQVIEQQLTGIDGLIYFSVELERRGRLADHGHVRARHQRGLRAGAGAEQGAAGPASASAGGAAAGPRRHQVESGLPAGARGLRRDRQDGRGGHLRLHGVEPAGRHRPHRRRRRLQRVRRAVRDAHLARSGKARELPADAARRDRRHPGAEHAGGRRPARRAAHAQIRRC